MIIVCLDLKLLGVWTQLFVKFLIELMELLNSFDPHCRQILFWTILRIEYVREMTQMLKHFLLLISLLLHLNDIQVRTLAHQSVQETHIVIMHLLLLKFLYIGLNFGSFFRILHRRPVISRRITSFSFDN